MKNIVIDSVQFKQPPISEGDEETSLRLLMRDELRRLVARYMSRTRKSQPLQPPVLVHEAYFRLVQQKHANWHNRPQVLSLGAGLMRRMLVNYAKQAAQTGDGEAVTLLTPVGSVLELNEALVRLACWNLGQSRVLELKFFGGLAIPEMAEVLQLPVAKTESEWSVARAWLYSEFGRYQAVARS